MVNFDLRSSNKINATASTDGGGNYNVQFGSQIAVGATGAAVTNAVIRNVNAVSAAGYGIGLGVAGCAVKVENSIALGGTTDVVVAAGSTLRVTNCHYATSSGTITQAPPLGNLDATVSSRGTSTLGAGAKMDLADSLNQTGITDLKTKLGTVPANLVSILGAAITGTAAWIAAAWSKLFNVENSNSTTASKDQTGDAYDALGDITIPTPPSKSEIATELLGTEIDGVTMSKHLQMISAFAINVASYNASTRTWTIYKRDGSTPLVTVVNDGVTSGNRTESSIIP
jgi:hypothetical protein